MYRALRPLLFRLPPEKAHHAALRVLERVESGHLPAAFLARPPAPNPRLAMRLGSIEVSHPLGVAAGFDKDARVPNALLRLGFGHVEVGTLTLRAQPGNEEPRMQRVPALQALVNRLGFPNQGVELAAARLARHPVAGVLGANVGPNKSTAPEGVAAEVAQAAARIAPHARFVTINVSSPNTPGLRAFQEPAAIEGLVGATLGALDEVGCKRPVFLKLHPDASREDLVAVARSAVSAGAGGLIATNTTRERPPGTQHCIEGGLSGAPLRRRSLAAVAALRAAVDVPIIGVGGVSTGRDVVDMVRAGANSVQAYTAFVYRGPGLAGMVAAEVLATLDADGVDRLQEVVGRTP